ncbi:hypothetical protein VX159_07265 [Dechloromonas sp. ZY10]|uniref:hypothetical protein n=1 Tax=Dechloromonas aquae TaxID=2664436 RepID=UPI003526D37C
MNIIRLLTRWFSTPTTAAALSYDEVFSAGQPERVAVTPAPAAIADGEAWFHEVFAGAVF